MHREGHRVPVNVGVHTVQPRPHTSPWSALKHLLAADPAFDVPVAVPVAVAATVGPKPNAGAPLPEDNGSAFEEDNGSVLAEDNGCALVEDNGSVFEEDNGCAPLALVCAWVPARRRACSRKLVLIPMDSKPPRTQVQAQPHCKVNNPMQSTQSAALPTYAANKTLHLIRNDLIDIF